MAAAQAAKRIPYTRIYVVFYTFWTSTTSIQGGGCLIKGCSRVSSLHTTAADVTCALQTLPLTTLFQSGQKKASPWQHLVSLPPPPPHTRRYVVFDSTRLFVGETRITRFALEIRDSSTTPPPTSPCRREAEKNVQGGVVNGKTKRGWEKVFSNPHADLFLFT